jgi:hypothetical protein
VKAYFLNAGDRWYQLVSLEGVCEFKYDRTCTKLLFQISKYWTWKGFVKANIVGKQEVLLSTVGPG